MATIEPTFPTFPEPQQRVSPSGNTIPLVLSIEDSEVQSRDAALAWLREKKEWVLQDILPKHGAIVFRGFPLRTAEDFNAFIEVFEWEFKERYLGGGGPRIRVLGPIKTSTETPAHFTIPFHHELSYVTERPSKLIFFCHTPAETQGETPILFSNDLVQKAEEVNPEFVARLKEKSVRYVRTISDKSTCDFQYQKCWQDIYDCDDRSVAEQRALDTGTETIEWLENGAMKVTTIAMPAIQTEPRTGLPIWLNAVCLLHPAAHDDDVNSIVREMRALGVYPKWQQGDVMLVDNFLAMHAREPFTGKRKILAAMIHN